MIDIEEYSRAMFNRKGQAILSSSGLTDEHVKAFVAASEALVSRANVRGTSSTYIDDVKQDHTQS